LLIPVKQLRAIPRPAQPLCFARRNGIDTQPRVLGKFLQRLVLRVLPANAKPQASGGRGLGKKVAQGIGKILFSVRGDLNEDTAIVRKIWRWNPEAHA